MRIGIDIRSLQDKTYSGVSFYTLHLLQAIFQSYQKHSYVLFSNSGFQSVIPTFHYPHVNVRRSFIPNKILNASFAFTKRPFLDTLLGDVDTLFLPNMLFASVSPSCRMIVTVHDIAYAKYPEMFSMKSRLWHMLVGAKNLLRRADRIIAVSENTKNDLQDVFDVPEKKISVVYPGVSDTMQRREDEKTLSAIRVKYRLPEKFFLYLGNIEPRKNIESVIRAFISSELSGRYALVLAGAGLKKKLGSLQLLSRDNVYYIGYIQDSDKAALYSMADAFIYVSYYEGFGFPPLEAMACGTPTIVSHVSSLPEVTDDAALLVDPHDTNDIRRAFEALSADASLRSTLINRGYERARAFSWNACAKKTIEIICGFPNL